MTDNNALAQRLESLAVTMDRYTRIGVPEHLRKLHCGYWRDELKTVAADLRTPAPASGDVGKPVAWMYEWVGPDPKDVTQFRTERPDKPLLPFWSETPLYTADMLERITGSGDGATFDRLAKFFREERPDLGFEGDVAGWSPVEAAMQFLRKRPVKTQSSVAQIAQVLRQELRSQDGANLDLEKIAQAILNTTQPTQQPGDLVEWARQGSSPDAG